MNLLALDMDAGTSEVNILNRLHLMVSETREQAACESGNVPEPKAGRLFTIPDVFPRELHAFNSYTSLEVEKWRAWVSNLGLLEKARNMKRRIGL